MKKLIYKLLIVIALLVAMNFIYKRFFYENDLQKYSEIIELSRDVAKDSCEIIYLGESSNNTNSWRDLDHRKISDFVGDCFPNVKCGDITKEASHAEVYYYLLKNIPADNQVKTVVVTMNMRSFGAPWIYSDLETPIQKYLVMMKDYPPLLKRFLLAFKAYPIKTEKEWGAIRTSHRKNDALDFPYEFAYPSADAWDKAKGMAGVADKYGHYSQALTELTCHYIKTYAFTIRDDNPRLKDFDNIVDLARKNGWHLVFNLMAENVDRINELVGNDLLFLVKRNHDFLVDRYGHLEDVRLVDNMSAVRDTLFTDRNWTTEHYMEFGRKTIAQNVARTIAEFYPDQYQPLASMNEPAGHFRNECENGWRPNWLGEHSFTEEIAWSGNKSSKIWSNSPYGLTLEVNTSDLPQADKVYVSMLVYQSDTLHDAQLTLQLDDEENTCRLDYFPIASHLSGPGRWDFLTLTLPVDSSFYEAKRLKFYVYNPSESPVFVDDFDVSFQMSNYR